MFCKITKYILLWIFGIIEITPTYLLIIILKGFQKFVKEYTEFARIHS